MAKKEIYRKANALVSKAVAAHPDLPDTVLAEKLLQQAEAENPAFVRELEVLLIAERIEEHMKKKC